MKQLELDKKRYDLTDAQIARCIRLGERLRTEEHTRHRKFRFPNAPKIVDWLINGGNDEIPDLSQVLYWTIDTPNNADWRSGYEAVRGGIHALAASEDE
jgi:hypothetical protein